MTLIDKDRLIDEISSLIQTSTKQMQSTTSEFDRIYQQGMIHAYVKVRVAMDAIKE
jgi:hypothetical protein